MEIILSRPIKETDYGTVAEEFKIELSDEQIIKIGDRYKDFLEKETSEKSSNIDKTELILNKLQEMLNLTEEAIDHMVYLRRVTDACYLRYEAAGIEKCIEVIKEMF